MELTDIQKQEISNAIAEMDQIQRRTAIDNLKKARTLSVFGTTASMLGMLLLWPGTGLAGVAAGELASIVLPIVLVVSIILALFTHQKLSLYFAEMRKAEEPLVKLGLKYNPVGSGVESDGYGRTLRNRRGYIVNKTTNTYLDIAEFV